MTISTNECYLSELYSGIQGEGPLVGKRQLFVRFSGCDLRCKWCDTPGSLVRTKYCELENSPGAREFQNIQNPVNLKDLILYINNLEPKSHHSISLTGGEPLLQADFLLSFIPELKERYNSTVYLETGGHRPKELNKIIKYTDYVSMDFKLPSSANAGNLWEMHKEFLSIALSNNHLSGLWIKIVVTEKTVLDDLFYSVGLVKSLAGKNNNGNNKVPLEIILQPVSRINGINPPDSQSMLDFQYKLLDLYPHIRVLPQVHKLIGQR